MWNNNNGFGGYGYPYTAPSPSFGGYGYPQGNTTPSVQPQAQAGSIQTNKLYANGIEDVRSRSLPNNSDFIFLDNDKPLVYRKTTDATGKMSIQVFTLTPYEEQQAPPAPQIDLSAYVLRSDFDALRADLEALREDIRKSANAPTPKKTS